jgi:glyceraldehyde 3-phosphate dehydrogenase
MSNKIRVSINGFGRIGRSALRAYFKYPEKYKDLEIVAINDIADLKTLAHLFKYDSVMGVFDGEVKIEGDYLVVNGKKIRAFKSNIDSIPWGEVNTDIVIESTGIFLTRKDGETHMKNGAKKVIFSAPAKEEVDATIVVGVNESTLKPTDKMVSNASCTTNCLTPLMKVLQDNFGVESAFMLTVHSYTGDQRVLDAPHKDLRRARAAAVSMIPTTTGATKAVEKVLTELKGKLAGYAVRVPTPDVSLTDVTATLKKAVTVDEINEAFKREAQGSLKGVLEYVDEPVVSVDLMGNPHSSIFDSELTQVINGKGKNIRVVSWYDNEWGYSNRIMDLAKIMGNL